MKIKGNKIYIRLLRPEDVTAEYRDWMNDKEITRFMESRFRSDYTVDELKTYVAQTNDNNTNFMFGIFCRETSQHIGNIKLESVNRIHQHADIGVMVGNRSFWGKGIGSEAIGLMVQFAFEYLGLNKVKAGVYQSNKASYKAFKKNGFQQVGQLKKHVFYQGKFEDAYWLEKLNRNFGGKTKKKDVHES